MTDPSTARTMPPAPGTEILRCEVGSTLHGIAVGSDDLDLMGVMVEPPEAVTGLERLEHHTWRSAPKGARSGPGDIDLVVYGLRKYLRLATQGNPSVILPLYAPDRFVRSIAPLGRELRALRHAIVSQRCRARFLGYLRSQRERAARRGGFTRGSREGRSGKWAAHMVRLGYEAVELLTTGTLTLPMREEHDPPDPSLPSRLMAPTGLWGVVPGDDWLAERGVPPLESLHIESRTVGGWEPVEEARRGE